MTAANHLRESHRSRSRCSRLQRLARVVRFIARKIIFRSWAIAYEQNRPSLLKNLRTCWRHRSLVGGCIRAQNARLGGWPNHGLHHIKTILEHKTWRSLLVWESKPALLVYASSIEGDQKDNFGKDTLCEWRQYTQDSTLGSSITSSHLQCKSSMRIIAQYQFKTLGFKWSGKLFVMIGQTFVVATRD